MPCAPLNRRVYFAPTKLTWENIFPPNLQNGICLGVDARAGPGQSKHQQPELRAPAVWLSESLWESSARENLQEPRRVTGKHR